MRLLAGLCLLLLVGCGLQPVDRHTSRVETVLVNPHAYSIQAVILACLVIIAIGLVHYWYRTKDKARNR